jgi:PAS domain S-box-containing protein
VRYAFAVLVTGLAGLVHWADLRTGGGLPFPTYTVAVALTAFLCGRGPAVVSMILGATLADVMFVTARDLGAINGMREAIWLVFYISISLAFVLIIEALGRSRRSLRESETRFRALADTAPLLIWTAGTDKSGAYVNRAWLDFTGRTFEQEKGRGWQDGIHPEDRELLIGTYERAFDAREPFSVEYRRRRFDGQYRWIVSNGVPRFGHGRTFTGYIGTAVDITERKLAELAVRAHEDRFRVAVDAGKVGVWEWNIPLDHITWSDRVYEMHGVTPDSFHGKLEELAKMLHPDDRPRVREAIRRAVEEGADYTDIEMRIVFPDGEERVLMASGRVIYGANGEPLRMVGACVDITTRKLAEEALRKSEKLAAAGRLAASIAHEINNPLEAVTNLLYLARLENSWANVQRLLESADHELQRVGQITRQTLGFYRESNKPQRFSLAKVVESVLFLYECRLKTRSLSVTRDLDPNVEINAVMGELKQVISNLLLNAADAVPVEGRLHIRVHATRHWARMVIADSGPGVETSIRSRIFEPFTTSKKDVGTGLGLWVSRQIVEKHGGTLRFRSSNVEGRSGTVFVLSLPLAKKEVLSIEDARAKSA